MRSNFTFDGSKDIAEAVHNFAVQSLNKVSAQKAALGIPRMGRVFDGPYGTQVYVLDYEFIQRVHIVAPASWEEVFEDVEPADVPGEGYLGVPDFVSGYVSPFIDAERLAMPWDDPEQEVPPERALIRSVAQTQRSGERIPPNVARYKLGVDESQEIRFLPNPGGIRYSEHAAIRPGFYSGGMRPVVQLLLGVGKIPQQTYERRWLDADETREPLRVPDDEELGAADPLRSAFGLYDGEVDPEVADAEGHHTVQVRWDYRFGKTHGISWGTDGRAYVVEIGTRGVFISPLGLDPVSLDEAGRARYEELYPELFDPDACRAYGRGGSFFDVFGGFPTGTYVASGTPNAEALIRAGEMVEAIDEAGMAEFYDGKQPYSSVLGWAFHPRGGEAHNCCNEITGSHTHHGHHYCVTFTIGEYKEPDPEDSALAVADLLGLTGWRRRKALRLTDEQAALVLEADTMDAARQIFDEIQVTPPFTATARLRKVKTGRLWGRPPDWTPPFKVPEPILGEGVVVSFVMVGDTDDQPKCDTPIFVCYAGDNLNVVNYCYRPLPDREAKRDSTADRCQFGGEWETSYLSEGEYQAGYFYSNVEDWRDMVPYDGEEKLKYAMQQVGLRSHIRFNILYNSAGMSDASPGRTYATVYYQSAFEGKRKSAVDLQIGVTVPYGDRSIYYMAKLERYTENEVHGTDETWGVHGGITKHVIVVGPYLGTALNGARPEYTPPPAWVEVFGTGRLLGRNGVEFAPEGTPSGEPDEVMDCTPGIHEAPPYSTQDARWIPEDGRGFIGHDSWDFGPEPPYQGDSKVIDPANVVRIVKARIFGDTALHGELVNDQELRYREDDPNPPQQTQGTEWMRRSPDSNGTLTVCAVMLSHFGKEPIINFNPDDEKGWRGEGGNEDMYIQFKQCYVGYIE